ncbi:putative Ig domain-containing protein [Actomonas aquatica]|uniref:Ig domain-containing protein n=1 Tax=Actomonas aquatica TaxID=2866162 RepID=A0ABZ1C239_9BACT|nr:putative Ig domain-containing protein [Opitutus sp. WL0086]WRQ85724.1 putative Ig domain-containing protein [Opitutus sp. WL0086]
MEFNKYFDRRWSQFFVPFFNKVNQSSNVIGGLLVFGLLPLCSVAQDFYDPLANDSDGTFFFPIQYNSNGDIQDFGFGLIRPYTASDSMGALFDPSGWFGLDSIKRDNLYHYHFRKNAYVKVITDLVASRESTRKRWDEQLVELMGVGSAEYSQARAFLTSAQAAGDVAQFLSESNIHQFKNKNFQGALRNSMKRLKLVEGKTPILDKVDSAMDGLSDALFVNDFVVTIAYYEAFAAELALERLDVLESQELFSQTLSGKRDAAWDAAIDEVRANMQALGQGDSMRSFILAFEDNLSAIIEKGLNEGYKLATKKLALTHPGWAAVPAAWSYFFTESADYVDALHYATIATTLYRRLGLHEPEIAELKYATQILAYDYILEVAENSGWLNWFQLLIFRPDDGSSKAQLQSRYESGRQLALRDAQMNAAEMEPVQVPDSVLSLNSRGPYFAFNGEGFLVEGRLSLDGDALSGLPVQIQLGDLTVGIATTESNGSFSFQATAPNSSGTHEIVISANYINLQASTETTVTTTRNVEGYDIELRLISGSGRRGSGGTSNVEFSVFNAGDFSTDVRLEYQVFDPSGKLMSGNAPSAEMLSSYPASQSQSLRRNFTVGNTTGLWRIVVTAISSKGDENPTDNSVSWGVFVGDVEDADGYTGGDVWVDFVGSSPWNVSLGSGYTLEIVGVNAGRYFQANLKRSGATVDSNERFDLYDLYLRDDILIYVMGMSNIGTPMAGIEYGIAGSSARATPAKQTVLRGEQADFLIDASFNIYNMDVLRGWRQGDTIDDQNWSRDRESGNLVFELQTSGLAPGNYEWFVSADDGSGRSVFQRLELTVLEPHDVSVSLLVPSSASSGDAVGLTVNLAAAGGYTEVSDVSLTVTGPENYSRSLLSSLETFQSSASLPVTWGTQGLPGGTYNIVATAMTAGDSKIGNNTASNTLTLGGPPELALALSQIPSTPVEGTLHEVAFQVTYQGEAISGATVSGKLIPPEGSSVLFNTIEQSGGLYVTSLPLNRPGDYKIEATATMAGYIAATLTPVVFNALDLAPESSIASIFPAEDQWVNTTSITLTGQGRDAVFLDQKDLLFSWQADYPIGSWTTPSAGESRFTVDSLGEGGIAVALRVSQLDGLVDPTPAVRNFYVDLTPPVLESADFDTPSTSGGVAFDVQGTASDALSGLAVVTASNGSPNLGTPEVWRFSVHPQDLPLSVRVLDVAGNETVRVIEKSDDNSPPVLDFIGAKSVNEGHLLSFIASATDPDVPAQSVTFTLIGAPLGSTINETSGAFTWTPTELQGPDSYTFTIEVSDGAATDSETITVTVDEVNVGPVLDHIGDRIAPVLTELSFIATASDADLPSQTLGFSLVNEPSGAEINDSTGVFKWTPAEAQAGSSYTFTVVVSDGTTTDSEEITVFVREAGEIRGRVVFEEGFESYSAGALSGQGGWKTYSGRSSQSVYDTGDSELGQAVSGGDMAWNLVDVEFDFTGVLRTEVYWVGSVSATGGSGQNTSSQVFLMDGDGVQPSLGFAAQRVLGNYRFIATGSESGSVTGTVSLPPATWLEMKGEIDWEAGGLARLSYRELGASEWLPTGIQNYQVTVTDLNEIDAVFIRDDSSGSKIAHIRVTHFGASFAENNPPVLSAIGDKTVDELTELSFTASATDPDLPAQMLTYTLVGQPSGASINPVSGVFTWTPTEMQGPGTYTFDVVVTDGADSCSTNGGGVSGEVFAYWISNESGTNNLYRALWENGVAGTATPLTFFESPMKVAAFDFDEVGGRLGINVYESEDRGDGRLFLADFDGGNLRRVADVHVSGSFAFSPDGAKVVFAEGENTASSTERLSFFLNLADGTTDSFMSDAEPRGYSTHKTSFTWLEDGRILFSDTRVASSWADYHVVHIWDDGEVTDLMSAVSGGTRFAIPSPNGSRLLVQMTTSAGTGLGLMDWATPSILETIRDKTSSGTYPLEWLDDETVAFGEGGEIYFMKIDGSETVNWTQSDGINESGFRLLTIRSAVATVGGASDSEPVTITVNEVNEAPVLDPLGNREATELEELNFVVSATDPDIPVQSLSYSLEGEPDGASIDPTSGVFAWTPTEPQGPGDYTFTVQVSDGVESDAESITVRVQEYNEPPVLDPVSDKQVMELDDLSFVVTATDPDLPAQIFSFSLEDAPVGASIDIATGEFTWTPSADDGPGVYSFRVVVSDGWGGTDSEPVTVTVLDRITTIDPESISVGASETSYDITITSNTSWKVESIPGWVPDVTPVQGQGNGVVRVSVDANTSSESRAGTILIGGQEHVLTQAAPDAGAAPEIVVPPTTQYVALGQSATFEVEATGDPAPTYQWFHDGSEIPGATEATYTIPAASLEDRGSYSVEVSNDHGMDSARADLFVVEVTTMQSVVGTGYVPGGTVTVNVVVSYGEEVTGLGLSVVMPPDVAGESWSYAGSESSAQFLPQVGDTLVLEWAWLGLPTGEAQVTYTLNVPAAAEGPVAISAMVEPRAYDLGFEALVLPDPLVLTPAPTTHSADTNKDFRLSLGELLRVIELYNARSGSVRTGRYAPAETSTEDGFRADPETPRGTAPSFGQFHSADIDHNAEISLGELLRVIELYNTREGSVRTGQYHAQSGTEDGFAPGSVD